MKTLGWLIRLVIFLVVLWFALANQHGVQVFAPMGQVWQGPLVWVLLLTLLIGLLLGVLLMLPPWWAQRRAAKRALAVAVASPAAKGGAPTALSTDDDGLGV